MEPNNNDAPEFATDKIYVKTPGGALERITEDYGIHQLPDVIRAVNELERMYNQVLADGRAAVIRIYNEFVSIAVTNIIAPIKNIFIQIKDLPVAAVRNLLRDLSQLTSFSAAALAQIWNDLRAASVGLSWSSLSSLVHSIGVSLESIYDAGMHAGRDAVAAARAFFNKLIQFGTSEMMEIITRLASISFDAQNLLPELMNTLGRMTDAELDRMRTYFTDIKSRFETLIDLARTGARRPESLWLGDPTRFPPNMYHFIRDTQGVPAMTAPAPVAGARATVSQETEATFTYLDIGKWGGSRRDFGIVCGATAVLCEFQTGARAFRNRRPAPAAATHLELPPPPDSDTSQSSKEIREINKVLSGLHGGNAGGRGISVIRHMRSRTPITTDTVFYDPGATKPTVYVFMGDMHIPVVDVTAWPAGLTRPTPPRDHPFDSRPGETFTSPWRVEDPHGRVMVFNYQSRKEVNLQWWYNAYMQTDGYLVDGNADLVAFMARLTATKDSMVRTGSPAPYFMQLGDMIDLWIGIFQQWLARIDGSTRARGAEMRGVLQRSYLRATSREFLDLVGGGAAAAGAPGAAAGAAAFGGLAAANALGLWGTEGAGLDVARTWGGRASNPRTPYPSQGIRAMSAYTPAKFLWGNHDNYFGLGPAAGLPRRYMDHHRSGHFLAEHGHRWDGFNADGAYGGNLVTQALMIGNRSAHPFRAPQYLPTGETMTVSESNVGPDLVRWAEPASRLRQIRDVSMLWRQRSRGGTPGFAVYVMGHTHDPGLAQIFIKEYPSSGTPARAAGFYPWATRTYGWQQQI